MTLGTGLDPSGGNLAFLMSAQEDRLLAAATSGPVSQASPSLEVNRQLDPSEGVNYAGGSSYSEGLPLLPSSVGLVGVMGAGINQERREMADALCDGLAGAEGLFETIGRTDTYLTLMKGRPWPPPLNQGRISAGYVAPTVMSRLANINQGWNAAAQPGGSPGTQVGYSEMTLGPSTWQEAMEYSPSPLADKIGSLQGLGAISQGSDPGLRKVLDAAAKPGTQETGAVARELLKQSVKLGEITGKRAAVMENARKQYTSLVHKVANIDSETQRIANNLFDADGEPRPNVSVAQLRTYRKLRQKGFKLGREAIRYQKTNILATGLTKNGYAQAKLLQDMAMTMMTGRGKTTAILAGEFDMIGKESVGLRAQRGLQVARWQAKNAEEKLKSLEGFEGNPAIKRALEADYWEADLAGMEFYEMEYLGALEGAWGWIKKQAKKAVKTVTKPLRSAVRVVGKVAKTGYRAGKAISRGKFAKAGRIATKAAGRAASSLYRVAKKNYTKARRKVVSAVKVVRKTGMTVYRSARTISKPVWRSVKAVARVAIAPVKMSYNVGRHVARGNFRGAANSIARSVKETASNIATAAGSITFGMACAIDNSPIGKAASQAVGQAVGTFFGGPVGGAVGNEAGRKANEASRGICKGMDRIGLTRGRVRPNQIGPAFKQTAKFLIKKTFSPKELLKSGINIGMNYATGGTGAGAAATQFAQQAAQRGVQQAVVGQVRSQVQSQIRSQIERGIQNKISRNPYLRTLSKHTPIIKAVYQNMGAFRGGEINMDVIRKTLQKQGTVALKKYGPQVAGRAVGAVAGRRAGQFVGTAGRIYNMTPTQRQAFLRRQAMTGGRRVATRAIRRVSPQAAAAVRKAQMLARMSPAQRQAFLRRQAMAGGRRLATRAIRRVSPQAAAVARRSQMLARMKPIQRAAYLRAQARRPVMRAAPSRVRRQQMHMRQVVRNRAIARARASARQRMGVPGALLRA